MLSLRLCSRNIAAVGVSFKGGCENGWTCFHRRDIIVTSHRGVAFECILDYAHFSLVFRGSCPVPGRASLSNDDDTNIHYYLHSWRKYTNIKCLQMKITLGTHSSYHTTQRKYWSPNVLLGGVEERSLLGWKVTSHTMPVYKETSPRAVPHKSPLGWSAWKGTL